MNKFCTAICLILAINFASCNIGARLFDQAFPQSTAYSTAAVANCTGAGNSIDAATDITAAGGVLTGVTAGEGSAAANNEALTVANAEAHYCLNSVIAYAASLSTPNIAGTAVMGLSQESSYLIIPGDRILGATTSLAASAGAANKGRLGLGAGSGAVFVGGNGTQQGNAAMANFPWLNNAGLGYMNSSDRGNSTLAARAATVDTAKLELCLKGVTNQGGLIACGYFNDTTTNYNATNVSVATLWAGAAATTTGNANAYTDATGQNLPGTGTTVNQSFDNYLTLVLSTTFDAYVCNSLFSGLAVAFGASATEASTAAGVCNLSNAAAAVLAVHANFTGDGNMAPIVTWMQNYVVGRGSTFTGTVYNGTAPTLQNLGVRSYCQAYSKYDGSATVAGHAWAPATFGWAGNVLNTGLVEAAPTSRDVLCGSADAYVGLPASSTTVTATYADTAGTAAAVLITADSHATWYDATNGACPTTTWSTTGNSANVYNCCMNSSAIADFVHCMNFLSTELNQTSNEYIDLLLAVAVPSGQTATTVVSDCQGAKAWGLNWLTSAQMDQFDQMCSDSTLRAAFLAQLATNVNGANTTAVTTPMRHSGFVTAYAKYWTLYDLTSADAWTNARASQLGNHTACMNAYVSATACGNPAATTNDYKLSNVANAGLMGAGQSVVEGLCDTTATQTTMVWLATNNDNWGYNCCMNSQSGAAYDSCARSVDQTATVVPYATVAEWDATVATTVTGLRNVLRPWAIAPTTPVYSWADNMTSSNSAQVSVWGWVSPSRFQELATLFDSGAYAALSGQLWGSHVSTITYTWAEYNTTVGALPSPWAARGTEACQALVEAGNCHQLSQWNSVVGNGFQNLAGTACTALTKADDGLDADDTDGKKLKGRLNACCSRDNVAAGNSCAGFVHGDVADEAGVWKTYIEGRYPQVALMGLEEMGNTLECVKGWGYLPVTDTELAALAEKYCKDASEAATLTDALTAEKCLHADNTANWHAFHACLLDPKAPVKTPDPKKPDPDVKKPDPDVKKPDVTDPVNNTCPCHATMLKTFGTGAIMVLLWNMLN